MRSGSGESYSAVQWVETVVSGVGVQEQRNRNTGNCGHRKSKQGPMRTEVGVMAGNSVGLMDLQRQKKHPGECGNTAVDWSAD